MTSNWTGKLIHSLEFDHIITMFLLHLSLFINWKIDKFFKMYNYKWTTMTTTNIWWKLIIIFFNIDEKLYLNISFYAIYKNI